MNANQYAVGQILQVATATLDSAQTTPPKHYSEDTLMDDMMGAYKFAKNDEDRALLKEIAGIGTSRTRGVIIKGLIDRGYLIRKKKGKLYELQTSPEGCALLNGLPDIAKDVVMTAKWERALQLVAQGKATKEQLSAKVISTVKEITLKLLPPPLKTVK